MISKRDFLSGCVAAAIALCMPVAAGAAEVGDNGLHIQPWFMETFLELPDDRAEAADEGKHLVVIFEQRGCPYCREMHQVNLAKPEIVEYIQQNFGVLQLDMWGSREVVDFDGEALEERALARKWGVNFTPTLVFIPMGAEGESIRDLEAIRMPGYFKPFHFVSMFEYVDDGAYKDQGFQRYLQEKFERLESEGKTPEVWDG